MLTHVDTFMVIYSSGTNNRIYHHFLSPHKMILSRKGFKRCVACTWNKKEYVLFVVNSCVTPFGTNGRIRFVSVGEYRFSPRDAISKLPINELIKHFMHFFGMKVKALHPLGRDASTILSGTRVCNSQNWLANIEKSKKPELWKGQTL